MYLLLNSPPSWERTKKLYILWKKSVVGSTPGSIFLWTFYLFCSSVWSSIFFKRGRNFVTSFSSWAAFTSNSTPKRRTFRTVSSFSKLTLSVKEKNDDYKTIFIESCDNVFILWQNLVIQHFKLHVRPTLT
jgi:hypothetical protein